MASPPRPVPHLVHAPSSSTLSEPYPPKTKIHLLVVACGPRDTSWAQALVVRLSKSQQIETRAIVDDVVPRLTQTIIVLQNQSFAPGSTTNADDVEFYRQQASELVEWADLMVCVPLDADGISKMLAGIADTLLGKVLRGWDTSKTIVLVPGMSTHMWANPTTKRHLGKLRRKWGWIKVINPITWHYDGYPNPKRVTTWNGFDQVLAIIHSQIEFLGLGTDVEPIPTPSVLLSSAVNLKSRLPPEIWTIVLDFAGDWELAKALGIYTNLPMPLHWTLYPRDLQNELQRYEHDLEWTVLGCNSRAVCKKLSQSPRGFTGLPAHFIRLVVRFALVDVLSYLEMNRPDLFGAFGGTVLPTWASSSYPRTDVLEYWKQSKYFQPEHTYDSEAVDGASKNGYVCVLDWWWRRSGLPLRYTESSLEQASAYGHISVLEWWRDAAAQDENVVLRPGRSLLWAAQYGQPSVLRWWEASGIPVAHGEGVIKMASRCGCVEVLETWRRLRGSSKMVYDGEILVAPTLQRRVEVLEWWQHFAHGELEGMDGQKHVVEFRPVNIQAALDENMGDSAEVREWWSRYGVLAHTDVGGQGATTPRHL